jgi:hypothetical protein
MWWRQSWFSLNGTIDSRSRKGALSYATHLLNTNQPIRAPVFGNGTISACVIPTRVKADSFRGFQNGANHVHQPPELGQCMMISAGWYKLTVRAGLSGATIRALVPRAPNVDLCPGRLATTDAQEEVAPSSAHTGSGRRRDGSWDTRGQDHG